MLATLLFLNTASLSSLHHQSLFAILTVFLSLFCLLLDSELLSLLCILAESFLAISLLLLLLLLLDEIIGCSESDLLLNPHLFFALKSLLLLLLLNLSLALSLLPFFLPLDFLLLAHLFFSLQASLLSRVSCLCSKSFGFGKASSLRFLFLLLLMVSLHSSPIVRICFHLDIFFDSLGTDIGHSLVSAIFLLELIAEGHLGHKDRIP